MTNKEKQCQALLISLPYYLVRWKHNSRKLLCGTHNLVYGSAQSWLLSYRNRGIYWTAGMFFFKIQETFTVSLWEPLKSISCLQFQDILVFEQRAKGASDLWISTFNKQMTVNVHILIANMEGCFQDRHSKRLAFPPKGSTNKLNQVVKEANSNCVARIVLNPSTWTSWEADPVLHNVKVSNQATS